MNIVRMGAIALTATLLVACGGSKDEPDTTAEKVVSEVEETVEETIETGEDAVEEVVEEATEVQSANAQALVDQCVSEGESEEVCNCQIGAVEEALGEEDFSKLIELAANDDEEGAEQLMTDIMSEKPEIAMDMGMKMMACSAG